jgi:3-oxoacyl-[acyl-carrier protein] reductase
MSGVLDGKVAVITGGASGIGLAIATLFAEEGARIGLIDLRPDTARAAAEFLRPRAAGFALATADVGLEAEVDAAFASLEDQLGPTAILVNCAGIDAVAPIEDVTLEAWERILRVHVTGTFLCCKRALPAMRKAGWGRIINTSSQLAHRGTPGRVAYCAAKAGILGFTRSLAYEVVGEGVTVNCLAPGPIDTPLVASLPPAGVDAIVAQVPAGRLGRPAEVAVAALMLAREEGAYFVGASLNMNGGHYMI